MRSSLFWTLLFTTTFAFGQSKDDPAVTERRIRAICVYVSQKVLSGKKPNLWPVYVDSATASGGGKPEPIHFSDTSVAHVYDDWHKVKDGMTIFLAPPRGGIFRGELRPAYRPLAGGWTLDFEFDGDRIVKADVRQWFN
jgi:hypothetical protein